MAQFPRSNGDAGGVAHYDVAQYVNGAAVGVGVTINPHGPAQDYISIDFGAAMVDADFETGGPIEAAIRSIQQLATVTTYEVQASGIGKFALYPVGVTSVLSPAGVSFIAGLQADIRALGTVAGFDLSGTDVTTTTFGG
jgi:hypothetical protein